MAVLLCRPRPPLALGVLAAVLCIMLETFLADLLTPSVPGHTQSLNVLYLPGILVVASVWGLWPGIVTAVASAVVFDYFIIPPMWGFLPIRAEDLAILVIFLVVALLTCSFAEVARSLTVEIEARTEADLAAELARLLLRAPDLKTALPAASQRLADTLGLPSALIEVGRTTSDGRHVRFSLHDHGTLGTLLVPAGLKKPALRRLRERVVPSLEVLLQAAKEREDAANTLRASRSRTVAATDEARRCIERDLHDGTQQRLVSLGLELRAIEASVPSEQEDLRQRLAQTAQDLTDALMDLQEISHGLHPAMLAKGGLEPALKALERRAPIPVQLNVSVGDRLPERFEVTVYYLVSEALTNIVKHAYASMVRIDLAVSDGLIRLSVRDDGVGGADPTTGSGLIGLIDRVEALGGIIKITSPPQEGTRLLIEIPTGDAHNSQ